MIITQQTLVDADGNPTAAHIPSEEFEAIQQRQREIDQSDDSHSEFDADGSKEIHKRIAEIDDATVESAKI